MHILTGIHYETEVTIYYIDMVCGHIITVLRTTKFPKGTAILLFFDKKIGEVLYYVQLQRSTYVFLSHFTELPVIICKDDLTGKLREILQY